ncbi:hypothetical protein tb265_06890 [Gemmatimonadetes bacterium T265]|nr:hypothetical protein tb265_06890 [Gemmatimonadetes bacterium T265]
MAGDPAALTALPGALERHATGPWHRDLTREANVGRRTGRDDPEGAMLCFVHAADAALPAASLWFTPKRDEGKWYVPNIVPIEKNRLSRDEYNGLVIDFARAVAEPAAREVGVRVEVTEPEAALERWMPEPVAERLRAFSDLANKSTGSSHPSDAGRWREFVIAAHEADVEFDAGTLAEWLEEDADWEAGKAQDLAVAYEQGRALLAAYAAYDRARGLART